MLQNFDDDSSTNLVAPRVKALRTRLAKLKLCAGCSSDATGEPDPRCDLGTGRAQENNSKHTTCLHYRAKRGDKPVDFIIVC